MLVNYNKINSVIHCYFYEEFNYSCCVDVDIIRPLFVWSMNALLWTWWCWRAARVIIPRSRDSGVIPQLRPQTNANNQLVCEYLSIFKEFSMCSNTYRLSEAAPLLSMLNNGCPSLWNALCCFKWKTPQVNDIPL